MQLIYRGHSYTCTATQTKSARQSRAINWRYRSPSATQIEAPPVNHSTTTRFVRPRAINWRYQILAEG